MKNTFKKLTPNQLGKLIMNEEIEFVNNAVEDQDCTKEDGDNHIKMVKEAFTGVKDMEDLERALSDIGYCSEGDIYERIIDTLVL